MTPVPTKQVASAGLQQLLSRDPGQMLLYAVEQAAERAHHQRLGRVLERLRRRPERVGWFHASELANTTCQRYLAARLLGYQFRERRSPQTQRILENGTYMHLRWQLSFLCLPPRFRPQVAVELEDWPVIGEADASVEHPDFGLVIIELKSMRSGQYEGLRKALPAHVRQLQMYMGMRGAKRGQVWYESKDTQDVKTFSLARRDGTYKRARERGLALVELVVSGRLPPSCDPPCSYDERVGRIPLEEERWSLVRQEAASHA